MEPTLLAELGSGPSGIIPPSNALWLTFIAAWRDEAKTKGSKAAQTYNKAYKSLSACPIPFQHPCQTTQLAGIGPTIASRLEQDLQKWCLEHGEEMPSRPIAESSSASRKRNASRTEGTAKGRRKAQRAENTEQDEEQSDDSGTEDLISEIRDPKQSTSKSAQPRPKATAKNKAYVPQLRSGAYGLLIGLYSKTHSGADGQEVYLTKAELIAAAQPHSDTDYIHGGSKTKSTAALLSGQANYAARSILTTSNSRSFYTGWNSMKTVISKGYVYQTGNPPKFCLSEEGFQVAATMAQEVGISPLDAPPTNQGGARDPDPWDLDDDEGDEDNEAVGHCDLTGSQAASASIQTSKEQQVKDLAAQVKPIVLPSGSYTIHLILDNRERRHSGGPSNLRESLATPLEVKGVQVEVRALEVGDAVWIARRKDGGGTEEDEVALDFILERKRLDDLTSSILDGRWRDQKFRLSCSGINQVVYLIEDHDVENQMRKFGGQIQTALSSTQIVDGFLVERTANVEATIDYLVKMDSVVRQRYENTDLDIIPSALIARSNYMDLRQELTKLYPGKSFLTTFGTFQALNSKSAGLTLREVFGKMLLCIRGMSPEKVREILEIWPTPSKLQEAYQAAAKQGETDAAALLLARMIDPPEQRKKIGAALSRKVYSVFRGEA